jgi:hypothetical protein
MSSPVKPNCSGNTPLLVTTYTDTTKTTVSNYLCVSQNSTQLVNQANADCQQKSCGGANYCTPTPKFIDSNQTLTATNYQGLSSYYICIIPKGYTSQCSNCKK